MQVKVEEGSDGTWIQVHGPVGHAEAQVLLKVATTLLRTIGPGALRLDLSAVSYLDANALGMLLQIRDLARERGAGLVLQDPSTSVRRVLRIAKQEGLLEAGPQAPPRQ